MIDRSEDRVARRIDRLVSDLLSGKRLVTRTSDAPDRDAIRRASQLAASSVRHPHMTAAFRERLAGELARGQPQRRISRRAALVAAFSAAGGLALGTSVERITGVVSSGVGASRPEAPVVIPGSARARWVDVGVAFASLEEGVPVRATAGAIRIFVVRHGPTVTAVSALCTHQPCELVWNGSGRALDCPCHGARFSATGDSLSPDYPLPPLPLARARVRDGRVEVLGTEP
jgi:nitrite reductase/ring-hydroxylating ferredoxin subunit